jgi:predicted RNA-binding protein Jag
VSIYGFRDVEQSLAVIHQRGSPVPRGEGGFPLLISYKGQLLKSLEKLEQVSDGNPEMQETEQRLEELDQTFKDHESLLREAQEYANKISRQ